MLDFVCQFEIMTDIWDTNATYTSAQIAEQTNSDLPLVVEVLSKAVGKEFEVHENINYREAMCAINAIKEQLAPQIEARKKREQEKLDKAIQMYDYTMDKVRVLQMQKEWRTAYKTISYFSGLYEKKLPAEYIISLYGECLRIGFKANINRQELYVWLRKAILLYRSVGSLDSIEGALDFIDAYSDNFINANSEADIDLVQSTLVLIKDHVHSYHLVEEYNGIMNSITNLEP